MKLSNKEKMDIIRDMVVVVDSRENQWHHIKDYLEEKKIPYVIEKLDVGDYSFTLPNYPHLNMDKKILIERKGSLDELAGNFTKGRERFAREFERMEDGQSIHLVLESFTWRKLLAGSYRSKFSSEAYKKSLMSWSIKYGFKVWDVTKQDSGEIIHGLLETELQIVLNSKK